MNSRYDVVIIGSGFGGSITACRLAQAGRSVCVLERGRRWSNVDFPRSPSQIAGNAFWDPEGGHFGLLDYRVFSRMHVIQGSGVGGGSLHYFNVHLRPPAAIFEDIRWPAAIDLETLGPYYGLAHEMLDAAPLKPPAGRALPARTTTFLDACAGAAGAGAAELVPIAVYRGPGRRNPHGAVHQQPCDYSGDCMLGCTTHAKNTLDLNYLALAERNGAEVYPLHRVHRIAPVAHGTGYRVSYERLDPAAATSAPFASVCADTVIVAAGTLGTAELLLRCRDRLGTLPDLSPALGHGFSGNGDLLLAGTLTDEDIDAGPGPSITAGADFATANQQMYVEDLGLPDPLFWFLEGLLAGPGMPRSLFGLASLLYDRTLGIAGATRRLARERQDLLGGGRTRGFLPYLGMCEDAADGEFMLDGSGALDLRWNPGASRASFLELEDALRELSRTLGGVYVPSPLWRMGDLLTAHPLGGCRMSEDRLDGVVDDRGGVHGYPGLFVVDGSTVPTALARNPTATISALAERAAFLMIHGRELGSDDRETPANWWPEREPATLTPA
ncbi:MAG: cholesterol oxidase [Solirubrobacteraceae bacterium]|nr:cholesterol oxidase [Solirubrobacteraceae bacterium]